MFDFVFSVFSQVVQIFKTVQKPVRNARGAILIEFAICVPILILLLFGLHDIFRMARIQDQTNFAAHLVVQMLQNVSQARKDKKITRTDVANIARFVGYVIYPGMTQYAVSDYNHFYGHTMHVSIYYIRGESDGKASVLWKCYYRPFTIAENTKAADLVTSYWSNVNELVKRQTNGDISKIYPKLVIAEGEVKIIVEVYVCKYDTGDYHDALLTAKEAFGTYLLTPSTNRYGFFNSVVIFTPRLGLFDEAGPRLR